MCLWRPKKFHFHLEDTSLCVNIIIFLPRDDCKSGQCCTFLAHSIAARSYKRWKGGLIFFFPPANLLCASLPSAISKLANWDVDSQTPCSWFWGQYVLPVWIQETLEAPCNHAGFLGSFTDLTLPPMITFRFNIFNLLLFLLYNASLFILPVIPSLSPTMPNSLAWEVLPRVWACVLGKKPFAQHSSWPTMEGWAPGSILPSRSLWVPQGHCDDLGHAQEKKKSGEKKKVAPPKLCHAKFFLSYSFDYCVSRFLLMKNVSGLFSNPLGFRDRPQGRVRPEGGPAGVLGSRIWAPPCTYFVGSGDLWMVTCTCGQVKNQQWLQYHGLES